MSDELSLRRWVSGSLHTILGYSDKTVEDLIIALGKQSKLKPEKVLSSLRAFDFPTNAQTSAFAAELCSRVSRKPPQREEPTRRAVADDDYRLVEPEKPAKRSKSEKKSRRRKRSKDERSKGRKDGDSEDDANAAETEQERRLREFKEFVGGEKERKELEERLKQREEERTKRFRKDEEEEVKLTKEEQDQAIPELREFSRQKYLEKREAQERELLRQAIQDEEELFQGVKLTAAEKRKLDLDKEVLRLAESRVNAEKEARSGLYYLPDAYTTEDGKLDKAKRDKVLLERYEEREGVPKTEQEQWEEHQNKMAQISGRKKRDEAEEKEYDFVFEDQIDFISHEVMKGTLDNDSDESEDEFTPDGRKKSKQQKLAEQAERTQKMSIEEQRKGLPIFQLRTQFLRAVQSNQVLVVVGQTGSGKTTQIPQYLHEAGYSKIGKIGCTQPRRVAAMSVAARVSQELGVKLGHTVGYSIRFEDCTSDKTLIKYMTDGMLLREFLSMPDLKDYSAMMIDEAHERTIHTDVLFGLLKDIARFRTDLKLIISSATLDAQKFSEYFGDAPIFTIPGRMYPVEIRYTKAPEADYLDASVVTSLHIHVTQGPGDILVFMTGQEEIEAAQEILTKRTRGMGSKIKELVICPIYASLPSEEQAKVFLPPPPGGRKVILATNIAETSLTINGIRYVVDTGFCKQTSYNPRSGVESLIVTPVSQAGAEQRAGRAGRTAPGVCFRLYTAWSYKHELDQQTVPEIQRTNLSNVVLLLKSLGINDLIHFDFLDPPPAETLIRSLEQLYALGALNDLGELTKLGRRMAEFPTDPQLAKMLLAAEKYECTEEALTICAMLDVNAAVFFRPPDKQVHAENARMNFSRGIGANGDHLSLMNVYNQWKDTNFSRQWCFENYLQERSMRRARDIREQLEKLCDRVELEKLSNSDSDAICKAITAGYFYHTAKLQKDGTYKTVKNTHTVHVHPSSCLYKKDPLPRWLVYHQLQFTRQEFMRQVIIIQPEWLVEIAPHYYKPKELEDGTQRKMPKLNVKNTVAAKERVTKDGIFY